MKQLKTKYTYFMHRHFKRYRLRKICQALDIVPYSWQAAFALGKIDNLPCVSCGRACGKTMAVMLRLLMAMPGEPFDVLGTLRKDPDFTNEKFIVLKWYNEEYDRLLKKCQRAGIHANRLQLHRLYQVI